MHESVDPWKNCQVNVTSGEKFVLTTFEDDFSPEKSSFEKLPDHEQYLEVLESKLRRLKSDPNVLQQLAAKRESCMQQLLSDELDFNSFEETFQEAVSYSPILRTFQPQKQALNQGELVELIKYDQLSTANSDEEDLKLPENESTSTSN